MKFFNLFSCLIIACAFCWANATSIEIPTTVNMTEQGGFALMATRPEYTKDENGNILGAVNYDIELKNCKYNVEKKTITCDFNDIEDYKFIFDVVAKSECSITENTTFKKTDLYGLGFDKKYNKTEFIVYYEREGQKITKFEITATKFVLLTDDNCNLTLKVTRGRMGRVKKVLKFNN